jgi:putative oxidoreductase
MITIASKRDRRVDTGLLILRTVVGVVFLAHGWQKLFVFGLSGTTTGFAQMGVPMPEVTGPLVAGLELVGGLALILGLWTRVFAGLLAIDMLGAIMLVHLRNGFFLPNGIEFALTLCAASVALALTGAGMMSVDDATRRRRVVELSEIDRLVARKSPRVRETV